MNCFSDYVPLSSLVDADDAKKPVLGSQLEALKPVGDENFSWVFSHYVPPPGCTGKVKPFLEYRPELCPPEWEPSGALADPRQWEPFTDTPCPSREELWHFQEELNHVAIKYGRHPDVQQLIAAYDLD